MDYLKIMGWNKDSMGSGQQRRGGNRIGFGLEKPSLFPREAFALCFAL